VVVRRRAGRRRRRAGCRQFTRSGQRGDVSGARCPVHLQSEQVQIQGSEDEVQDLTRPDPTRSGSGPSQADRHSPRWCGLRSGNLPGRGDRCQPLPAFVVARRRPARSGVTRRRVPRDAEHLHPTRRSRSSRRRTGTLGPTGTAYPPSIPHEASHPAHSEGRSATKPSASDGGARSDGSKHTRHPIEDTRASSVQRFTPT
jgi:hypothetical protein